MAPVEIDSSSEGLDRLHRRLSRKLAEILHSPELSRSSLLAAIATEKSAPAPVAMPMVLRPGADGHDLLVGAAASVVHDWWMLPENGDARPPDPPPTEWSDDILDRASTVFEVLYEAAEGLSGAAEASGSSSSGGGKTMLRLDLSQPLGMGLTPDGTVLTVKAGGQGEAGGVAVGSQVGAGSHSGSWG